MLACKPFSIPMEANNKLTANSVTKLVDPGSYRRLVGRLLYLTISRPDICYWVHKLSQFVSNHYTNHMHVANMLLQYLKHIAGQGIVFRANSDTKLHAYVDAN